MWDQKRKMNIREKYNKKSLKDPNHNHKSGRSAAFRKKLVDGGDRKIRKQKKYNKKNCANTKTNHYRKSRFGFSGKSVTFRRNSWKSAINIVERKKSLP